MGWQIQKRRTRHAIEADLRAAQPDRLDAPPESQRHKDLTALVDGLLDELALVLGKHAP